MADHTEAPIIRKNRREGTMGGDGRRSDINGADEAPLQAGVEGRGGEDAKAVPRGDEPELDPDDLIETLAGLAELDGEAAAAYTVAATAMGDDDEIARRLTSFRDDHRRHVRELNRLIQQVGGAPIQAGTAEGEGLLEQLAESAAAIGPHGLIVAMIGNEMLTNGTYQTALELPWSDEVRALLERNRADEERHLRWLLELRDRLGIEFPEPVATA
jgi:rubrerythrin